MKFNITFVLLFWLASSVLASKQENTTSFVDQFSLNIKYGVLQIVLKHNFVVLNITKPDGHSMHNVLHTKDPSTVQWPLAIDPNCGINRICIKGGNKTHTVIQAHSESSTVHVIRSVWNEDAEITDCYQLVDGTEWYGGPQWRYQHWPIQRMYFEEEPYLPTHANNMAVSERYWLSSNGIFLYVDESDPLFLDQNNYKDKNLCLVSKNKAPYRQRQHVSLNYRIGVFPDPRTAQEFVTRNYFMKQTGHPNERMITHPIWSTWARYKVNINDTMVERFADEIISHGFNNSQIEIDDNWETCYGSAEFNPTKFPNITSLAQRLKRKGFRVTLWIHPFINKGCEPAYSTALNNSYFVRSVDGNVHTQWWQGADAGVIDFTNDKAVDWWVARLKRLQRSGIDSFKFDAGEASWLPQVAVLNSALPVQPGIFTYDYVNALARNFDDSIEVRVGWRSQGLPIFVRMIDKDTRWTWNNGLPTLITTLLQMNLNGYIYVLPDMIGGNGYINNALNSTVYPDKELFIRWLQANVFMPAIQYSFVPWDFDNETIAICKKYTDLHAEMAPIILTFMKESIKRRLPLNAPVWWIDSTNPETYKINDQYLLGSELLVAPVIEQGAVSRDIYLPSGRWLDGNTNATYKGRIWLRDYPAPLDVLPYFIRQ